MGTVPTHKSTPFRRGREATTTFHGIACDQSGFRTRQTTSALPWWEVADCALDFAAFPCPYHLRGTVLRGGKRPDAKVPLPGRGD